MQCGHERADNANCDIYRSVPREYLVLRLKRVQAHEVNANIAGIEVRLECLTRTRRKA
jgi:hypothetical protein